MQKLIPIRRKLAPTPQQIAAVPAAGNINVTVPRNRINATVGQEDTLGFVPGVFPGQFLLLERDGIDVKTKLPVGIKGIRELGPFDWVLLQWDSKANWHRVYDGGADV